MTAPSRRAEINRQRARKAKIKKLRQKFTKATSENERKTLLTKLQKVSTGMPAEELVKAADKK